MSCVDKEYQLGCYNDGTVSTTVLLRFTDDNDGEISEILDLDLNRIVGATPANTTIGACQIEDDSSEFAGQICYGERRDVGQAVALTGLSGTLPNGTNYTLINTSGTEQHSTQVDGDWRWENSSIMRFEFDRPVTFIATPISSNDLANPLVWSRTTNNATPRTRIILGNAVIAGGTFTYTPGAFDIQPDLVSDPNRADSTLFNAGAPSALDDWGTVTSTTTTLVRVEGRDAEAMNFTVIETEDVKAGEAYIHKLSDGTIEHRDVLTNEVVVDPILVDCSPSVTIPESTEIELLGSLMCYEEQSIPQTASFTGGTLNGTIDVLPTFVLVNVNNAPQDLLDVLDSTLACVNQGGTATLVIEDDDGGVTTITPTAASFDANTSDYRFDGVATNTGGLPELVPIESANYTCSIDPSPILGKSYARNNELDQPVWYDHITHAELTAAQVASLQACPVEQSSPEQSVSLVDTDYSGGGARTITAPFRSLSITAISGDVQVNGVAIPQGITRNLFSNENEEYTQDQVILGSSYFITEVK